MVTSMLVNFLLMCVSVLTFPYHNPTLAKQVKVIQSRLTQQVLAGLGMVILSGFLVIHIMKDLSSPVEAWYFHSTPVWIIIMAVATLIYFRELRKLRKSGVNTSTLFSELPPE
jgi:uncharacterized membrane protein